MRYPAALLHPFPVSRAPMSRIVFRALSLHFFASTTSAQYRYGNENDWPHELFKINNHMQSHVTNNGRQITSKMTDTKKYFQKNLHFTDNF